MAETVACIIYELTQLKVFDHRFAIHEGWPRGNVVFPHHEVYVVQQQTESAYMTVGAYEEIQRWLNEH